MKNDLRSVFGVLFIIFLWFVYLELMYAFLIVVLFNGPWIAVHVLAFISSLLIVALTVGSQTKDR